MSANIETLESRTLFAAGGGGLGGAALVARAEASADPAVQATLALVRADGAAIEAARTQMREDSTDTRPAFREVAAAGAALLAADRLAVVQARAGGDAAALDAAREKLNADRQQVRDDVAAARSALRDDTADGRTALRDAMTSLRDHVKQLRADLRNAAAGVGGGGGVAFNAPVTGDAGAGNGATLAPAVSSNAAGVPSDEVRDVVDQIRDVIDNATPPDDGLVDTLIDHLADALDDRDLTQAEREQLRADARAVLDSANVSRDDLRAIGEQVRDIVRNSNLRWRDLFHVAADLAEVSAPIIMR